MTTLEPPTPIGLRFLLFKSSCIPFVGAKVRSGVAERYARRRIWRMITLEPQFQSVFASFATFCSNPLVFLLWGPKFALVSRSVTLAEGSGE
jgi:hypothetical protein